MSMDSQELKSSYERQQQRMTSFANPLQLSSNGPSFSVSDSTAYANALSRLSGSLQGDLFRVSGQSPTFPQANGRESLLFAQEQRGLPPADTQKDVTITSTNTERDSKRRKGGGSQSPHVPIPANGNLIQHIALDASVRLSMEPVNPSLSRLPPDASHVGHNRASMEAFHSQQRSCAEVPRSRSTVDTSCIGQYGTPMESMHPSPSRSSSEGITVNPTVIHPISSRLAYDGSARNSVQNFSVNANPSCPNTQISTEYANAPSLNESPQNLHASNLRELSHSSDISSRRLAVKEWGCRSLATVDPHLHSLMEREKTRQWKGIELIASENFTSQAVMEVLGSHLVNKYSEGLPGARYYGGNEYIDQIESLCRERALTAFHLEPESWGVNVQPYSCTSANFATYTALLQPKDRIMGLDSPSGGHLSHGYYTSSGKRVSAASIFFENLPYKVKPDTGYVDYDKIEEKALDYRPKILICGGSAYPREWDYARFRQIADKVGAILMCDMAHISGLVAAQECVSPFDYCDIVTSTTHKSLRGPRGGMIFYRKGPKQKKSAALNSVDEVEHYDFEDRVNFAVFPSLQGGPHNNQVAALAVALKQVATPEYKSYIQQVKKNCQALSLALQKRGCKLVTDGTDNHLLLWDIRPFGLTGYRFEKVCESCHMTLNKNAVYGDSGMFAPGGVRIGTPAMTSRGCMEADFEMIAEFLFRAIQIAIGLQREHGKQNKDFIRSLQTNKDIEELKQSVEKFAASFEMPGFDTSVLKAS